jgi:hypothetical protein
MNSARQAQVLAARQTFAANANVLKIYASTLQAPLDVIV